MTDSNVNISTAQFELTDRIEYSLEQIERDRWVFDRMLMPKPEAWLRREVPAKRASGTTRIEGASLDERAVDSLFKRAQIRNLTEDEQANLNAKRAYEFVDYFSDQTEVPLDSLVILQLNRLFLEGVSPLLTPGVYRNGQNSVGNYEPPNQGDMPDLMRAFTLWLRQDDSELNPVLKAGIAHIQLVAIHPFWDGNGRVARALSTLVLQRSPFSFKKLLSLDSLMFELLDDYFTAIERSLDKKHSSVYDATSWLEFFTSALMVHTQHLVDEVTDWYRWLEDEEKRFEQFGLTGRYVDGYLYARRLGQITRLDYMEVTRTSAMTASRDLKRLVEMGLLSPTGKTRDRVYYPVEPTAEGPTDEPDTRQLPLKV